jgi:hypothetical protein
MAAKKIDKYGKSAAGLLRHKQKFFLENDSLCRSLIDINKLYAQQKVRGGCKNCGVAINPDQCADFEKHEVGYLLCPVCGHLNGRYEDSAQFCNAVYTDNAGQEYAANYLEKEKEQYTERVREIYKPKADFLIDSLSQRGEIPETLRFTDIGAGSGYFVNAIHNWGITKVTGLEVSKAQVDFGNSMLLKSLLKVIDIDSIGDTISNLDSEVVSMIGVLEHLQDPRKALEALAGNVAIRYLFLSVPTFSPSVFFEMVFPEGMPRQLSGAHTHLYTKQSLDWLAREFDFEPVSRWWFGTDFVDLFRFVSVALDKDPKKSKMLANWQEIFEPLLDELQLVLDRAQLSSEVHILFRTR